jgi:hypothetical protein
VEFGGEAASGFGLRTRNDRDTMPFVNPWLLAGSALVAIPIVLHLAMRRRPRHFEFPALRFVESRHDVNQRRLRLRHLLLLLLRALAILLLAVALARPSVKFSGAFGSQEAPVAAALVFDTSMRMQYQHENRTRLEAAQQLGLWLLAQLPRDSRIAVVDSGPGPAAFQVDRGAARHRIERLATVANARRLSATLDDAVELLRVSELARREIYVFSDMARASGVRESAARLQDRLTRMPDVGVYVIDVGVEEPVNTALGDLRLSREVLSSGGRLRIETGVFHRGPAVERTVELYVSEAEPPAPGDREQGDPNRSKSSERNTSTRLRKAGQTTVALGPGEAQQVRFEMRLGVGTHQGYVAIAGQDGLACDDRRFFTVEVKPAWKVLVAAPKPAERFSQFLTQMLAPESYRRTGQAPFDCDVIGLDALPEHALEPYAAVCLVDPTPLGPDTWAKLGEFVSGGGGLAVFLGRKARQIESFNGPEAQKLLPGRLLREARRPAPDRQVHLAPQDLQHPILAELRDIADSIPWQAMPVFRYWQLGKLAPGVDVVVAFNDGQPAILERPVGKGRVLTMTTPVSEDPNATRDPWNLLPVGLDLSWPFFVLVNDMAVHLVGSTEEQRNYYAGQTAVVRLDPSRSFRACVLTTPDGADQVDLRLSPDPQEHALTIPSTDQLGNYRIRAGGPASGIGAPTEGWSGFSVNLAREQTRLDRLPEEELADVFGPVPYRVARDRNQLEGDRSRQRIGRELFGALILLVAVVLGIEHVLANRFYGNDKG